MKKTARLIALLLAILLILSACGGNVSPEIKNPDPGAQMEESTAKPQETTSIPAATKDDTVYTIYAISGNSSFKFRYAFSETILEMEEANSLWFSLPNPERDKLIKSIDEIREFVREHSIDMDHIRIVLLHDALSSHVWEADADAKGLDVKTYEQQVKDGILKELGL